MFRLKKKEGGGLKDYTNSNKHGYDNDTHMNDACAKKDSENDEDPPIQQTIGEKLQM